MSKYSSARNNPSRIKSNASTTSYRPELFDDGPPSNFSHQPPSNPNNNKNNNNNNSNNHNNNHSQSQSHYSSNHSNKNNNNKNNKNNDYSDDEDSFYGPSRSQRPQPRNNNNNIKRRVPPPASVIQSNASSNPHYNTSHAHQSSDIAPQQFNNNPSQPQSQSPKRRQNPPSYPHHQSQNATNNKPYNPPPQSRSSQYHQPPHDYPEYVQHELKKEQDLQAQKPPNHNHAYAHSEQPQNNYQYQQRHSPNNHANHNNHKNRPNYHTQSEQAHYRGANRRQEITADPHSLQNISAKLPKRPRKPFTSNANDKSNTIFPIELKSNSTKIKFRCDIIIKYDLEFIPPVAEDAKIIRRKAIQHCYTEIHAIYGTFFDDNTRVYAEREVKGSNQFYYADHKSIVLKFGQKLRVQELDLQFKKNIQGIFLQSLIRKSNLQRFGRGHFDMKKQARIPIHGTTHKFPKNLSLLPGYRTSLETTVSGVMIGIDTCHRLIEDRTVQELMDSFRSEVEKDAHMHNRARQWIEDTIRQLTEEKLITRHIQLFTNGKLYRVDRIDWNLNINSVIPNNPDGTTIKEHWSRQYFVDLKCEDYGIIIHYSKLKKNEQRNQVQFIPPEICCLTGVSSEHRNQRSVTTGISKATKIPAFYRMKSTNKLVERFHRLTVKDQDLRKFIEIPKAETESLFGQVLQCPNILLRKSKMDNMKTGPEMLQFDCKKCTFIEKGWPITQWAIAYNCEEFESVGPFISSLKQYATEGGFAQAINEETCRHIQVEDNNKYTWKNTLCHAIDAINEANRQQGSGKLLQCLIAIIPSRVTQRITDRIYQQIKEVCSTERAILSQCILAKHTSKNHVITGVLRQLLVKLGSIPWKIEFNLPFKRLDIIHTPTMIVGINVNHAQKCNASAVGIAASFDRDYVRYYSLVIHQKQAKECIAKHDLKPVIEQSLDNFHKINGCYPAQIIVYRDGVSETQIELCFEVELAAFREVISQMQLVHNQDMKLEFIAVQKRVNARFLISNNLQSAPPGTAINDVVVSNQFWDFYLVPSKPPPKCVAIPTRCIVIADDLKLSDEDGSGEMDLMHFTNALCTLYFNWPGPTRVPAPIKYAQKIAQQYCQTLPQKHPHHLLYNSYHFL